MADFKSLLNTDPDRIRKAVMRRFSPLDGIGKDLTKATSYEEALRISKLGFEPRVTGLKSTEDDDVDGYKAIFNDNKLLSVVKEDYTVVSNYEAFAIAEDLASRGFKYCVSNIQKDGARCRLILVGPTVLIADEEYTPYAIFNNSFDLSRSISVQFMFERNVCLNDIMRRAPGVKSHVSLAHFGDKATKLQKLATFEESFNNTLNYLQCEAEVFRNTKVSKEEFRDEILPELVAHVFQRDADAAITDRQLTRTQAFIDSVLSAYDAEDTANFNGTAYKIVLTMTDLDSHLSPFVNRSNPDIYINRILQTDTIMSMANFVSNYLIKTRKLKI